MKVAVTGKGGVGKTTLTAILARTLARSGASVVAVDADPNPNLAIALGMGVEAAKDIDSVANALLREKQAHTHDHGHGHGDESHDSHDHEHSAPPAHGADDLLAQLGAVAPDGVRLLQTGRIERPSDGCLCCGSHRSSRRIFDELDGVDQTVVADLEAGVNDLMWVWPKAEDVVVIVTEPYQKSLQVAARTLEVARELGVGRVVIAANRIQDPSEAAEVAAFLPDIPVVQIPDDPAVTEAAAAGLSTMDTAPDGPAVQAVTALAASLSPEGPDDDTAAQHLPVGHPTS